MLHRQLDFQSADLLVDWSVVPLVGDGRLSQWGGDCNYIDYNRTFIGQVPIAILCCFFIAQGLRNNSSDSHEEDSLLDNLKRPTILCFDFPGALALAVAVTLLLSVIDLQSKWSWTDPLVQALFVGAALSIATFLYLETWPGNRELLIPTRLLRTEIGAFCAGQILIAGSSHGVRIQVTLNS